MSLQNHKSKHFLTSEKYWGIAFNKIMKGCWSIGIFLTYDSWTKEFYIHLNLIRWSISIGRLIKL